MKRADEKTIVLCFKLLDEECEKNRYRNHEIMQGVDGEKNHALDVYKWVKEIKKNASTTLKIAALFHDIDRIITPGVGAGFDGEKNHALDVYKWVKEIKKNASTTLKIAALFHDIDRIITPGVGAGFKGDRTSREYKEHKKT